MHPVGLRTEVLLDAIKVFPANLTIIGCKSFRSYPIHTYHSITIPIFTMELFRVAERMDGSRILWTCCGILIMVISCLHSRIKIFFASS